MKKSNLFWGTVIVILGALLLAKNMQVIQWDIWSFFWPAVVILAGVWFLLKSSSKEEPLKVEAANVPLEGATAAEIEFNHGAGRLEVNAGAAERDLLTGSFAGGVMTDVQHNGSEAKVSLRTPTDHVFEGPWPTSSHGYEWKVGITPTIPVKLHFHTGASESVLDLHGLKANEIIVETGASSSELILPENAGYSKVHVKSGVASIKIKVPAGVAANIHVQSGLSGINIDTSRFVHDGENYRSTDYDTAANKAEVLIESGVGSVEIQ